MARIRTIKPAFFSSLSNAELPKATRLTWIGLWTYVDDAGRAVDDPRLVKAAIWPLDDDYTTKKVDADLALLAKVGKIERYKVAGRAYLRVVEWHHQRINRPVPSTLPPSPNEAVSPHDEPTPEDDTTPDISSEDSLSTQCVVTEDSPPERKGREGNRKGVGKEGNAYKSSSSNSSVGVEVAEEEEFSKPTRTATAAVGLMAERRRAMRTGPPITNMTAWMRTVTAEIIRDHGDEALDLAAQGHSALVIADRIMPLPKSPYPLADEPREAAFDEADDERGRLVAVPRRTG